MWLGGISCRSVWGVIFQWGSTLKLSIELPATCRHRRDITERLLKATLSPNQTNILLYIQQNNQMVTTSSSPLINIQMRPVSCWHYSVGIYAICKPISIAQHISNMFSYQRVSGAKIVSLEDSEKKWEFLKNDFLPPKWWLFSEYLKISIFSQNNDLSQTQSCKFHFLRGKRHTAMARKRGQPFKRLKLPWWFPIDRD